MGLMRRPDLIRPSGLVLPKGEGIPLLEILMPSRDFKRTDRVGAELRRELGLLVHAAVRDHALPSVSVSDVEVTRDLDWATVWVTALQPERAKEAVKALNELGVEFRRTLSRSMRLRRVPELRFKYDDSVDKSERIERLLRGDGEQGTGER
jgi:ribosome-binding factor A